MRLFLVIASVGLIACSESSKPEDTYTARYSLILVNDKALPATIELVGLVQTEHRVTFGDLAFANGRATQRISYDSKARNAEATPTFDDSTQTSFARKGTMLLISRSDRGDTWTDTGYVDSSLLILSSRLRTSLNQPTAVKHTLKFALVAVD